MGFFTRFALAMSNERLPRIVLCAQLMAAIMSVMAGVSETNPRMAWATLLIPTAPLFVLVAWVCPFIILAWCIRQRPARAYWYGASSIALCAVTIYGLLPLVQ